MVIVLDENFSLALANALRQADYKVISVAETAERGMTDGEIWGLAKAQQAMLITQDHGFTNPVRFPSQEVRAAIYIRRGNLRSKEAIELVINFLSTHKLEEYEGCLVTLWPGGVRIR